MPRASANFSHPISQDALLSLLRYDPETGIFVWLRKPSNRSNRIVIGATAGSTDRNGYVRLSIGGRLYLSHVLAWLYMTGEYVVRGIDHKDTDRSSNRWSNLRRATEAQNCANRRTRSDNALGVKGVYFHKKRRRYIAQIKAGGKQVQLGEFRNVEAAKAAYDAAAANYFGEFARAA